MIDYSQEFKAIVEAVEYAGGDIQGLIDKKYASLVINGNTVLAKNEIKGISIRTRKIKDGVSVNIIIEDNTTIPLPVHLCFGLLPQEGKQIIRSKFTLGKNAKVKFISHCSFPNAKHVIHIMDNYVELGEGSEMEYTETHYHSKSGGTEVYPVLRGRINKMAKLREEFKLVIGRVGLLDIDYEVEQMEKSVCELDTKVYGKYDDKIKIREALLLNGPYATGMAKSRVVLKDNAYGNVIGEVRGNAPYTRGHTDCEEVVYGDGAKAESSPIISVSNPLAKITHEASIGRIDRKELETLMARGLDEESAVDLIVNGMLK